MYKNSKELFRSTSFLLFTFPSLFVELPKTNIKVKSTHWSVGIESKHFAIKTQFLKLLKLLKSLHLFYFVTILHFSESDIAALSVKKWKVADSQDIMSEIELCYSALWENMGD